MAEQELFVYNVLWEATEAEIKQHFGQCGEVTKVYIPMDRDTKKPRGFVFVTMSEPDAERAIAELHDKPMQGRILVVKKAEGGKKRT